MSEIKKLGSIKGLKGVSLYRNPISEGENQKEYIETLINLCPNLESLDHVPIEQIWEKIFQTDFPKNRNQTPLKGDTLNSGGEHKSIGLSKYQVVGENQDNGNSEDQEFRRIRISKSQDRSNSNKGSSNPGNRGKSFGKETPNTNIGKDSSVTTNAITVPFSLKSEKNPTSSSPNPNRQNENLSELVSQAKSDPNSTIDKKLQRQDRNQIIKQRLAQINQKPLNIKRKDSLDDEEGG